MTEKSHNNTFCISKYTFLDGPDTHYLHEHAFKVSIKNIVSHRVYFKILLGGGGGTNAKYQN